MSPPDPLIGRIIGGRYRLDASIGEGGFGQVYRGTHLELGTAVAVKIARNDRAQLLARFRREALAQERLESRFTVRVRDFGREPDGLHYLVQNFIDGSTLLALIEAGGVLLPSRAVELCRQVCLALDEAHLQGIIHRDIKPANIMVVQTWKGEEVRLLDFGIAKILDDETDGLTVTGQVFGTVAYMAPEQIQGRPATAETDIYALGGVLFHALAGHYPYLGSIKSVGMQHLLSPPPQLPPHLPAGLQEIVQRAMSKPVEARYPSAREMAEALELAGASLASEGLSVAPVPAHPLTTPPSATTAISAPPNHSAHRFETSQQAWRGEIGYEGTLGVEPPSGSPRKPYVVVAVLILLTLTTIGLMIDEPTEESIKNTGVAQQATSSGALTVAVPDRGPPSVDVGSADFAFLIVDQSEARDFGRDTENIDAAVADATLAHQSTPRVATRKASNHRSATRQRSGKARKVAPPPPTPAAPTLKPQPQLTKARRLTVAIAKFEQSLESCNCEQAESALSEIDDLSRDIASTRRPTYRKKCQTALPGSCL